MLRIWLFAKKEVSFLNPMCDWKYVMHEREDSLSLNLCNSDTRQFCSCYKTWDDTFTWCETVKKGKRMLIAEEPDRDLFKNITILCFFLVKHSLLSPKVSRLSLSLSVHCLWEITTKRTSLLSLRQKNSHGPLNWSFLSLHLL